MADDFEYRGVPKIGTIDELESYLSENSLDESIITLNIKEYYKLESIVNICEKSGTHTKFVPDYYKFITTQPYIEDLNGLPVINIRNVPLSNTINKIIKRIIDIIGAIVAIILFSPIMLVVAILVKVTSPGPVIFSQVRVGLHNKEFKMYKFRSMCVQNAAKESKAWTTSDDPRVTKVGKFIRRTSIDELPQFFNVLKGDMSLVGPRPERPELAAISEESMPEFSYRLKVKAGLTGYAQVMGKYNTTPYDKLKLDLAYIENYSLMLDIKLILMTVKILFVPESTEGVKEVKTVNVAEKEKESANK